MARKVLLEGRFAILFANSFSPEQAMRNVMSQWQATMILPSARLILQAYAHWSADIRSFDDLFRLNSLDRLVFDVMRLEGSPEALRPYEVPMAGMMPSSDQVYRIELDLDALFEVALRYA